MKADYTQQLDGNTPTSQMISTEKKLTKLFFRFGSNSARLGERYEGGLYKRI